MRTMSDQDRKSTFERWEIPQLPSATDQLFIPAEDWWNNACLNYHPNGWAVYASGYKEAADIVVREFCDKCYRQDALLYPAVFLYRQYLELALKDLIRQARDYLDMDDEFPKVHQLDDLWRICRALTEQIAGGSDADLMEQIGRLIGEFCTVDPLSQAFRYPEDKKGNPSLPGIMLIDLANIRDVIQKIAVLLDGADAMIEHYASIRQDMAARMY